MNFSFNNFNFHLQGKWILLVGGVLIYVISHTLQGLLLCWGIAVLLSLIDCCHDTKYSTEECQNGEGNK